MKNFFSLINFEKFKINLATIGKRFPLLIVIIFSISTLFFILIHSDFNRLQENNIFRGIFTCIITFFLSLGFYLTSESLNQKNTSKYILQGFSIIFGILFFVTFKINTNETYIIYFILTLSGIISYFFIAPFIKKIISNIQENDIYYSYFYKISVVFLMSFILGGVLFALGAIGITAIFTLFDIKNIVSDKLYLDWATIALCFLTPIFALTQIPSKETFSQNTFIENLFFSFLVKYITIPFIYFYFIILYIYSIKVLINFGDWPKGEVSWMVIGFSIFGYLIYMFSSILQEKNIFIKFFRKCFPFVVIPQLFMLFYAIYLRIMQYDITMNRYFVVVFGIWLFIISVYFVLSKQKNIYNIPFILTIFTIIISIGPWGVYSLPETRQLSRLETNLTKAGILNNGKIIPLKDYTDINQELSKEIYSGIDYLCDYNDCETIKELFIEKYTTFEKKHKEDYEENKYEVYRDGVYYGPSSWEITNYITEYIKVKSDFEEGNSIISFYLDGNSKIFPLDINGYSKIFKLNDGNTDLQKGIFEIMDNGKIIDIIDIKTITENLLNNYKITKNTNLKKEELTYELKGNLGNYKILIENISIKNPLYKGNDNGYFGYIEGYILVK